MLNSAIKYCRAFHCLSLVDKNYKWCPSKDDWVRAISMCEFLKPFHIIINLISGSSYPTSNLYFGEIWRIGLLLTSNMEKEDLLIQSMCCRMKFFFLISIGANIAWFLHLGLFFIQLRTLIS